MVRRVGKHARLRMVLHVIEATALVNRLTLRFVAVNCPVGTFYNVVSQRCVTCPAGSYQDQEAQVQYLLLYTGSSGNKIQRDTARFSGMGKLNQTYRLPFSNTVLVGEIRTRFWRKRFVIADEVFRLPLCLCLRHVMYPLPLPPPTKKWRKRARQILIGLKDIHIISIYYPFRIFAD